MSPCVWYSCLVPDGIGIRTGPVMHPASKTGDILKSGEFVPCEEYAVVDGVPFLKLE